MCAPMEKLKEDTKGVPYARSAAAVEARRGERAMHDVHVRD